MIDFHKLKKDATKSIHNSRYKSHNCYCSRQRYSKSRYERTLMYWHIGRRIFEEEQEGKDRADYGSFLIKFLSQQLQPEYGSGFSYRQLNWYRQFYRTFPIVSALRTQLSWTQYKLLLVIDNQEKR